MLSDDTISLRHLPRRSSKNCDLQLFGSNDRFKANYSIDIPYYFHAFPSNVFQFLHWFWVFIFKRYDGNKRLTDCIILLINKRRVLFVSAAHIKLIIIDVSTLLFTWNHSTQFSKLPIEYLLLHGCIIMT